MNPNAQKFITQMSSKLKSKLFLFAKLPSAFFSGVRIKELNEEQATVTVPYKWFSQNPFGSTYFACMAMAAEMSTGLLGMMQVYERNPSVSMLVVKLEANYFKKAVGLTHFICDAGTEFKNTVEECLQTGLGKTITAKSRGTNEQGELVAEFFVTWSFKAKSIS